MTVTDCAIVILAHNGLAFTRHCLERLLGASVLPRELFLIDNGSDDETYDFLTTRIPAFEAEGVQVISWRNEENKGCSRARNEAWEQVTAPYTVFLDNDTAVCTSDWLNRFLRLFREHPSLGVVGPKLIYPYLPHPIQCAGVSISRLGRIAFRGRGQPRDSASCAEYWPTWALISACWMMRTDLRERIGMLDELFHPVQYEDLDLCIRARLAGYEVAYTPEVEMYHFEGITTASFGQPEYRRNIARNSLKFRERYHKLFRSFTDELPKEEYRWLQRDELGLRPELDLSYTARMKDEIGGSDMFRAGVGRRDISNYRPLFLVGYPHVPRISTGVHDPLYATALYLSDGTTSIIVVSVDILFVYHATVRECRRRISEACGVPPENIMISATHTHSGPVTGEILSWKEDATVPPPDPEYLRLFRDGIVAAAIEASRASGDAELAVTRAHSEGVGGNRLDPNGPRDPEVGLLMLRRRADKKPMGLLLVYSMHPTVLHEDSTEVSADFPGYTRAFIEERMPTCRVLYHTGPSGNQSPRYHVSGQTFAEARRLGEKLGSEVYEVIGGLDDDRFTAEVCIRAMTGRIELPARKFGSVAEAEGELAEAIAHYQRLSREEAPHGPLRTAECTVFGAEEKLTLARLQEKGITQTILADYNPAGVQVFRIGNAALVGFPGECFVEYALAVKGSAPDTFVISLANGELQGYIATPDATGYEARLSFFEPAAGDLLVQEALRLVKTLRTQC